MAEQGKRKAEVASGLYLGDRMLQQDSVESYEHVTSSTWLLALSDGIGGAGNGHLASRLIVRSALTNLKSHLGDIGAGTLASEVLNGAALAANRSLATFVKRQPDKAGMGGTLLLAIVTADRLFYLSIGDSLIYRLRVGKLSRLNTLHSLAGGVEALAATGQVDVKTARAAAMRSTLTSALTGEKLSKIDLPADGVALAPGDVLMLASDGIETLSKEGIAEILRIVQRSGAAAAVSEVISRVEQAAAPHQDNVSLSVVALPG